MSSTNEFFDYLDRVGRYSFADLPLGEADLLLLNDVLYMPFWHFVPTLPASSEAVREGASSKTSADSLPAVTLLEAWLKFEACPDPDLLKDSLMATSYRQELFRRLARSQRFGRVALSGRYDHLDPSQNLQFLALTARLPLENSPRLVLFRGSMSSLLTWRENMMLATEEVVPGQQLARKYLERVAKAFPEDLVVSGHSKGGNLALFSGLFSSESVEARIKHLVMFDSPSLAPALEKMIRGLSVRQRITHFIPESAVIGRLLEPVVTPTIIKSDSFSLFQHDLQNWQLVDGKSTQLARAERLTSSSDRVTAALSRWNAEYSPALRAQFFDVGFNLLESTGFTSFSEIESNQWAFLIKLYRAYVALPERERVPFEALWGRLYELLREEFGRSPEDAQLARDARRSIDDWFKQARDRLTTLLETWRH